MCDYLLAMSRRPLAKRLIKQLGLPLPLPEPLLRADGRWTATELSGQSIELGSSPRSSLRAQVEAIVTSAGGHLADPSRSTVPLSSMVFDASKVEGIDELGSLYDFIKPRLERLKSNGRVVIIGRSLSSSVSPEAAAANSALIGFAKSLAKELGRRGSTCQVILVADGGDNRTALDTPLTFLLSRRSAFISGQAITVGRSHLSAPASTEESLTAKVALVTGAAQGIGAAITRRLAAEGAIVIGHDRPQEAARLKDLMAEVKGHSLLVDLSDPGATQDMVTFVRSNFSHIDIVVNNAGITRDKTLSRMPRDWWDSALNINLMKPLALSQALLHAKNDANQNLFADGGRIICLSSIGGIAGNLGQTNYAAAKSGLIGAIHALAEACAPRNITVNALAPGFIETRMTANMPTTVREVARRFNSLKQGGLPVDVAEAATFFAMPGSGGISGEVLRVCGQNLIGA